MQIDIQSRGFALTHALREYTGRRLRFALVLAGGRVRRVAVRLFDVNGPRGGIDKRCHIRGALNGLAAVVTEDAEADLYLAINRAADPPTASGATSCAVWRATTRAPTKNPLTTRRSRRADGSPDQPVPMKGSDT